MKKESTPFKLKSGNTSTFKNLGSSPAKQVKGNPYKGWHPQDIKVDKLATRTDLSKVQFEKKLAKITKTVDPYPNVKSKPSMPKNFNIKGDPSKTPGRAQTKMARQVLKQGAKKSISRLAGPVGAGLLAYDVLKTGTKRVAKGIKTGKPQTKLKGKNIKDTFKRVKKEKYI